MEKLMETKLLWTGPNLRVRVALVAEEEAEEVSEDEAVAEEEEVDLAAEEAGEALEVEEASEVAEEEEEEGETSSHKERRRSLNNSFHPNLFRLILKKGLWGFTLLPLKNDRAF